MKLSEKGFLKLCLKMYECLSDIKEREFEADDFEMVTTPNTNKINGLDTKNADLVTTPKDVRLTLEEAKMLRELAHDKFSELRSMCLDDAYKYKILENSLIDQILELESKTDANSGSLLRFWSRCRD